MLKAVSIVALLAVAGAAQAQINGVVDPAKGYGAPIFQQGAQTGFGSAPNGSELAAIYCQTQGNDLRMLVAGSLESNFNKLVLFFGTGAAGGQNQLTTANPTNDGWAPKYNGFRFDNGFSANYMLVFRRGNGNQFDVDFAKVGGAAGDGGLVGSIPSITPNGAGISNTIGSLGNISMTVGYTSSTTSIGGAQGTATASGAGAAATGGLEFTLPFAALGLATGSNFLLSAHITNGDYNYLSNQFAGSLPGTQTNLGSDGNGNFIGSGVGAIDLNNVAGNQFIQVPTPAGAALLGLGGLVAARRRRA